MAVFKSLHFGESIKALKGVIRYNTVNKKGFNSDINPRLISVISNVGFCDDVNDQESYKRLTQNLILDIEANSLLSTNKRQKYLYEHSTISFDREDDERYGMKKLTELALKIANEANPNGAPQMLWPQIDSGKLHFHLVRGMHDENGVYQKKKHEFIKINNYIQKLEVEENLTLTGKNNPDNYIWKTVNGKKKKTYFPQSDKDNKVSKNKDIDYSIKVNEKGKIQYFKKLKKNIAENRQTEKEWIQRKNKVFLNKINKIEKLENSIDNLKKPIKLTFWQKHFTQKEKIELAERAIEINNKNNEILKIEDEAESKKSRADKKLNSVSKSLKADRKTIKKLKKIIINDRVHLNENTLKSEKYNDFRTVINNAYRTSKNAESFLKALNENDIEACISYRSNGQGGISFNALKSDISLAGGKVNSYLTFGKIKKNDPELFALLTGETGFGEITLTNKNQINNDINIEYLNKNYKQKINPDGSTSIFYNKKDAEKYPHNHNLKINADKTQILFGQNSNNHDIKLAYNLAKESGWRNAKSDSKSLIMRSMTIAYKENKEDLFFFSTNEPTLKLNELKEIVGDDLLSKDNLIKLYDNNLIVESDKKEMLVFIKNQLKEHKEDLTVINSLLGDKKSLKECLDETEKRSKMKDIKKEKISNSLKNETETKITIPTIEEPQKNRRRSSFRM